MIRIPNGQPAVASLLLGPLGNRVVLEGGDQAHGNEPWVVDLDAGSAALLRDICPGQCGGLGLVAGPADYEPFAALGNIELLWADDGAHGRELWRTDGTAAGSALVADLNPGEPGTVGGPIAASGSSGWFVATFGAGFGPTLWKTDGTDAGTVLLHSFGSQEKLGSLTPLGTSLYFFDNSAATNALWTSDGTAAGTMAVSGAPAGQGLVALNGTLFFWSGDQLWIATGSSATMLASTGSGESLSGFTAFQGLTWFASGAAGARVLWRSDGTPTGTVAVFSQLNLPMPAAELAASDAGLFISSDSSGSPTTLWLSDGTDAGTRIVTVFPQGIRDLTGFGAGALFNASSGGAWFTDGTDAGSVQLTPLPQAKPAPFVVAGGRAWFERNGANPGIGNLFSTDGTPAGTQPVPGFSAVAPNFITSVLTPVNGALIGTVDTQLWRTDGTDAGTFVLTPQGPPSTGPVVAAAGDAGYFIAINAGVPNLYVTDGTLAGTAPIAALPPNASGVPLAATAGQVMLLLNVGGGANPAFVAPDGGLTIVSTINPGAGSLPRDAVVYQGRFYFLADASSSFGNAGFYVSDGTVAGTRLVAPVGYDFANTAFATELNGVLYFAGAGGFDTELWRTDGTDAGTYQVTMIDPSQGARVSWTTVAGGALYFAGGFPNSQLYHSDGTTAGTVPVPGPANPIRLTEWNGRLAFLADDGSGQKLWVSDGTAAGTVAISDALTGYPLAAILSASERICAVPGGPLLFPGGDALGNELWASYGTPATTFRVMDLNPGVDSSSPSVFTLLGDYAFFTAVDGTDGFLWAIPVEHDAGIIVTPFDGGGGGGPDSGSSSSPDSGSGIGDAGTGPGTKGGCHCGTVEPSSVLWLALLAAALAAAHRRRASVPSPQ